MNDLIVKLEEASEGSRELDGDIAETLGYAASAIKGLLGMKRRENRKGYAAVDRGEWARYTPTMENWKAPPYTTSIDAALELMMEEMAEEEHVWTWLIKFQPWALAAFKSQHREVFRVGMTPWNGKQLFSDKTVTAAAPTPSLALCIAILKVSRRTK